MNERLDAAVIGGGPAGTSVAIALARLGRSVALFEQSHYNRVRVGETLPPVARLPLLSLGVWKRFVDDAHAPSHGTLSVWGQEEPYENNFIFDPYGHGWHLDRRQFDEMLALAAEEQGTRVWRGTPVTAGSSDSGGWKLEFLADGEPGRVTAKFLVDATGRASAFARRQGANRIAHDRLVGMTGFFPARCAQAETDNRTLVEATREGWWYSAWLPGSQLVAAFMTDADLTTHRHAQAIEHWWQQLERAPHTLARVRECAPKPVFRIFPAQSYRLDRMIGDTWLAAGDAAAAFDPLSSKGIYNGLESGLRAAAAIHGRLSGDKTTLEEYAVTEVRNFEQYLRTRAMYYKREQRWPLAEFWRRR